MKVQAAWMNQTFRFTFYSAQVFSSEFEKFLRTPFENIPLNIRARHKVLFVNCSFCNCIISYSFENFCEVGDDHFQKNV